MKNLILILVFIPGLILPQFKVEKLKGTVQIQTGTSEEWSKANVGENIAKNSVVSTGVNSSALISGENISFNLKESSALSLSDLKPMTTD